MKDVYEFTFEEFLDFANNLEKAASNVEKGKISENLMTKFESIEEYQKHFPNDVSLDEFENKHRWHNGM